jgi:DNA-binding LacI/PurR family transcriptional regulator
MAGWPSHSRTTYRHPTRRMAQATVELIKEIDVNPSLTPVAVRVPGQLVPRQTHIDRSAAGGKPGQPTRKRGQQR